MLLAGLHERPGGRGRGCGAGKACGSLALLPLGVEACRQGWTCRCCSHLRRLRFFPANGSQGCPRASSSSTRHPASLSFEICLLLHALARDPDLQRGELLVGTASRGQGNLSGSEAYLQFPAFALLSWCLRAARFLAHAARPPLRCDLREALARPPETCLQVPPRRCFLALHAGAQGSAEQDLDALPRAYAQRGHGWVPDPRPFSDRRPGHKVESPRRVLLCDARLLHCWGSSRPLLWWRWKHVASSLQRALALKPWLAGALLQGLGELSGTRSDTCGAWPW